MAHHVDIHVGKKVFQRRWMLGMTQQQLAERVGIRFQQIQKYESGANRISASRLWEIAGALETPVSYFFDGLDGAPEDLGDAHVDILNDRESLELVRAYYSMPEAQRRRLYDLAKVLGSAA